MRAGSQLIFEALESGPDEEGTYFLDRDGRLFAFVLGFLEAGPGRFVAPAEDSDFDQLLHEAKVLGIRPLQTFLKRHRAAKKNCEIREYEGAPIPLNEDMRVERLQGLSIWETDPEHRYDAITRIVAALMDVPMCLISLVGRERQWFKSQVGLNYCGSSRNSSFCAFMLTLEDPTTHSMLVVEDAHKDPRFSENPLVTEEPRIRFYAGSPLVTSDGLRLGALCAMDKVPRLLTPQMSQILVSFSQLAVQAIEAQQLRLSEAGLEDFEAPDTDFTGGVLRAMRMKEAVDEMVVLVWCRTDSLEWPVLYANQAWTDLTGVRITPPTRLPAAAQVEEQGPSTLPAKKPESGSLWDFLWLANESPEHLLHLWQHVDYQTTLAAGRSLPFAVQAVLAPRLVNGATDYTVSCRFMPADVPLDVNTAAIRSAMSSGCEGGSERLRLFGDSTGDLYFVTVTPKFKQQPLTSSLKKLCETIPEHEDRSSEFDGSIYQSQDTFFDIANMRRASTEAPMSELNRGNLTCPPRTPYPDVRLLREVARMDSQTVYFGTWVGACVAIKIISFPEVDTDWVKQKGLERVFSSDISHPNLAQTYFHDTQVDDIVRESNLWIVREWCDGGCLASYCKEQRVEGPLLQQLFEICAEVCSALNYMHTRDIFHGSLAPGNILLKSSCCSKGFVCKVTDFCSVLLKPKRRLRPSQFTSSSSSKSERLRGAMKPYDFISPHLPPEAVVKEREGGGMPSLSAPGDIFAMGMVIYQVAKGEPPSFWLQTGRLPEDLASAEDRGRFARLPSVTPRELRNLYMRCIAADPAERPTAQAMIEDLHDMQKSCLVKHHGHSASYRNVGTLPVNSISAGKPNIATWYSTCPHNSRRAYTPPGTHDENSD